jgi:hypothetical protein
MFRFVALQSKVQEICNYIGVDPNKMDSIILYERTSLLLQIRSCFKNGSQLGFSIPCPVLKLYL